MATATEDEGHRGTRRLRLPRPRLTPLRAVALTIAAIVGGLYVWGIFFYGDEGNSDTVKVEWLQVDPPRSGSREAERPFARSVPFGEDTWRAYVVRDDQEPRLAYESHRLLAATRFMQRDQRLAISALSYSLDGPSMMGTVLVDLAGPKVLWERMMPASLGSSSAAGERFAIMQPRPPGPGTPATNISRSPGSSFDLYVIEPDGRSRRLSAPWPSYQLVSFSPDGSHLIISALSQPSPVSRTPLPRTPTPGNPIVTHYLLTPYEAEAVPLGRFDRPPAWSPDGKRVAGVAGSELYIFDVDSGETRTVDLGTASVDGQPLPPPAAASPLFGPTWNETGTHIGYRGAVIVAATGKLLAPVRAESGQVATTPSPDGAWAVISDYAGCAGGGPQQPQGSNRTSLLDTSTGQTVTLLGCDDGSNAFGTWLSDEAVLLTAQACGQQGCRQRVMLARLPEGSVEPLTDELNVRAGVSVSPDGRRILVGGSSLRVFSSDGELLRTLAPPESGTVTAPSWSSDGRSFAYVVGPSLQAGAPLGPPAP